MASARPRRLERGLEGPPARDNPLSPDSVRDGPVTPQRPKGCSIPLSGGQTGSMAPEAEGEERLRRRQQSDETTREGGLQAVLGVHGPSVCYWTLFGARGRGGTGHADGADGQLLLRGRRLLDLRSTEWPPPFGVSLLCDLSSRSSHPSVLDARRAFQALLQAGELRRGAIPLQATRLTLLCCFSPLTEDVKIAGRVTVTQDCCPQQKATPRTSFVSLSSPRRACFSSHGLKKTLSPRIY